MRISEPALSDGGPTVNAEIDGAGRLRAGYVAGHTRVVADILRACHKSECMSREVNPITGV